MIRCELEVTLPFGVHLRPATALIDHIKRSKSKVFVTVDKRDVRISRVTDVLKLELQTNKWVTFKVVGPDEEIVLQDIKRCIQKQVSQNTPCKKHDHALDK